MAYCEFCGEEYVNIAQHRNSNKHIHNKNLGKVATQENMIEAKLKRKCGARGRELEQRIFGKRKIYNKSLDLMTLMIPEIVADVYEFYTIKEIINLEKEKLFFSTIIKNLSHNSSTIIEIDNRYYSSLVNELHNPKKMHLSNLMDYSAIYKQKNMNLDCAFITKTLNNDARITIKKLTRKYNDNKKLIGYNKIRSFNMRRHVKLIGYNHKRINPIPSICLTKRSHLMKYVFIKKLYHLMNSGKIGIFLDESHFNSQNFRFRGWKHNSSNNVFALRPNRVAITLTIACTEENIIFHKFYEESCNGITFLAFIKELVNQLDNPLNYFLYLDNVPFHRNKNVIDYLQSISLDTIYAVNNYCVYNPCEYIFCYMKRRHYLETNLTKKLLYDTINRSMQKINSNEGDINIALRSFLKVYQNILSDINMLNNKPRRFTEIPRDDDWGLEDEDENSN
jgi:hypothetical protein